MGVLFLETIVWEQEKLDNKEVMRTSLLPQQWPQNQTHIYIPDLSITPVPFLVGCLSLWRFAAQISLVATVALEGLSWPLSATVPTDAHMLGTSYASSAETNQCFGSVWISTRFISVGKYCEACMAACTHELCRLPSTQAEIRFYCLAGFLSAGTILSSPPPHSLPAQIRSVSYWADLSQQSNLEKWDQHGMSN